MDETPLPSDAAAPKPAPPVAFSLWHLFALTTGIAISLALVGTRADHPAAQPPGVLWLRIALAAVMGATVSGAIVGIIERARGSGFPSEPGHSLLFLTTVSAATVLVSLTLPWQRFFAVYAVGSWTGAALAVAAAIATSPHFGWRGFFLLSAYVASMVGALTLSNGGHGPVGLYVELTALFHHWAIVAVAALAIGLAIGDLWRSPRPDWLHWLGIGGLASNGAVFAAIEVFLPSFF